MVFASDLISKGFFPEQLIPPFNAKKLSTLIPQIETLIKTVKVPKKSKCAQFSVPKTNYYRRYFSIPNPLHQIQLCIEIEKNWSTISTHINKSKISMVPSTQPANSSRAFDRSSIFSQRKLEEIYRSTGSNCVLITDISNYYGSIYTHSIAWALHGKDDAKRKKDDKKLLGNIIDRAVRNTQDQQTMGIPVGPDTSHIIAEIIGSAIDSDLLKNFRRLKGSRYVDDFSLFFDSWGTAEFVQNQLERILQDYELQLNSNKTKILELPKPIEPPWVSELRLYSFRDSEKGQESDLINFFSRAYYLARKFPYQNVMKYAIKKVKDLDIHHGNWELFESLLLNSIMFESTCIPVVLNIFYTHKYVKPGYSLNVKNRLQNTLEQIIVRHSPYHEYEVAWTLWLAKVLEIPIGKTAVKKLSLFDDCIIPLISLDLMKKQLLKGSYDSTCVQDYMIKDSLYDDHWLLAYEALKKNWLIPSDGVDYIAQDPFFSFLRANDVEFYDTSLTGMIAPTAPVFLPY